MSNERRPSYASVAPQVREIMLQLTAGIHTLGLPEKLLRLVFLRASQLNGCAFCVDMHAKDMRAAGESEQRVYMTAVWRESALYDAKERAALAWTEAVTLLPNREVSDEAYHEAKAQFSDSELAKLTLAVIEINGWNRLNIAFRTPAGHYQPNARAKAG
ncbi:MAG TPA: carboxymuconolactone decarboxylase family protein [Roseiarcus sp.]|nr:carboxymuconolactone decarboxylase family protein [Roseiarcus sp.]